MTDYGTDLSCVTDLDPAGLEVSGRTCLAQAIARRLQTPRGGLIDDPNYGFAVTAFLNDDLTARDLALIASNVQAECVKDERVISASATVTLSAAGVLTVAINLVDFVGPFRLVLGVSALTVAILQVT